MHTPEKTLNYLKEHHLDDRLEESDVSFHHVEDAYKFNLKSDQVAKSLLFYDNSKANGELAAVMVVMSGDSKISTGEFKRRFGYKTSMCSYDDVVSLTGYKPGGVCPFGIDNPNVKIFLDISLKK
jgi:prolyl-tRNA editing enzyme YbaK/EbsC (Cys-tRNA(Pro) deacylase)